MQAANDWHSILFSRMPLFYLASAFAVGASLQSFCYYPLGLLVCVVCLGVLLTVLLAMRAPKWACLSACFLWLSLGYLAAAIEPKNISSPSFLKFDDGLIHITEGEVTRVGHVKTESSEEEDSASLRMLSVDLRVRRIEHATEDIDEMVPQEGGLRLTIYAKPGEALPLVACGDSVRVDVRMHPPQHYADPGVWDSSQYLREQGVDLLGSARTQRFAVLEKRKSRSFSCWMQEAQQHASDRLIAFASSSGRSLPEWLQLHPQDGAMLAAMAAGDRSYLSHELREGFERTGSFHLLVVSGMHLAIVAGMIFALGRRLRLGNGITTIVTIVLSAFYAAFTGFGAPVLRSLLMVSLYLLARLIFREKNALNAIGFAALCLLALHPHRVFDSGLQMTLLSVITMAGFAAPLLETWIAPVMTATRLLDNVEIDPGLAPRVAQLRVTLRMLQERLQLLFGRWAAYKLFPTCLRWFLRFVELLLISALMELVMMLPMALYFHRITAASLPVNVLLVPFVGVLLPAAFVTLFVLFLAPSWAVVPATVTAALLHAAQGIVQHFGGEHSVDWRIPTPAFAIILATILLWCASLILLRLPRGGRVAGTVTLLLAAAFVLWPKPLVHDASALELEAIDVGQGDSLLLITPDGHTMLVDAGGFGGPPQLSSANAHGNFDIGEDVVSSALWARGIRRLDVVALSHAHSDHMGGMQAILKNFRPKELWVGKNPETASYRALLREAADLGIPVRQHLAGESFPFGGSTVDVFAPDASYLPGEKASNNDSLVLRVGVGATAAFLEGDAEDPVESAMLKRGNLHSAFLKVGHHGSASSTTEDFLKAVSPQVGVISVGARNHYEHPREETLEKLQASGVRTYRTDLHGISCFLLDGKRVTAKSACR